MLKFRSFGQKMGYDGRCSLGRLLILVHQAFGLGKVQFGRFIRRHVMSLFNLEAKAVCF
jgi:hypothetical protein